MRDLLVLGIILGSIPFILQRPVIGIYLWYWISLMNPHRLSWGIAYSFPVALVVGLVTITSAVLSRERAPYPSKPVARLLIAQAGIFTMTSALAIFPSLAWDRWQEIMKILLMTGMTMILIRRRSEIRLLLIVVSLSIGFFAVKGAVFGIATGGSYRVYGPPHSAVQDNNALALAVNMILPIALFFWQTESHRWIRLGFLALFLCCITTVVLSYSRGGFLGLATALTFLAVRGRKISLLVLFVVAGALIYNFVPERWTERISTIQTYEQDQSAMSRIHTWQWAWALALDRPLTGGGFQAFRANPTDLDAHSIYFGMLGEQGFPALVLFLILLAAGYFTLSGVRRMARRRRDLQWYYGIAGALQVSLATYCVSGAFLNLEYFDLMYVIVATVVVLDRAIHSEPDPEAEPPAAELSTARA